MIVRWQAADFASLVLKLNIEHNQIAVGKFATMFEIDSSNQSCSMLELCKQILCQFAETLLSCHTHKNHSANAGHDKCKIDQLLVLEMGIGHSGSISMGFSYETRTMRPRERDWESDIEKEFVWFG